jgi:hypothetical protein
MGVSLDDSTNWAQGGAELGAIAGTTFVFVRGVARWLSDAGYAWEGMIDQTIRIASFWALVGGLSGFVLYFAAHVNQI